MTDTIATTTNETSPTFTLPLAEPGPILPTAASLAWKKVETETALNFAKLRGLGRSKKERIIAAVPTMGDFEKLRRMAVQANRHLSQMLPKGVGEDVADELVDRAIAWRAAWEIHQTKKAGGVQASGVVDVPPAIEPVITASDTAVETPTDASNALDDDLPTELESAETTISQAASPRPSTIVESPLASGEGGVCIGGFHEPTDAIDELFGIAENT